MIAVDTNVLVYAHRRELAEHDTAMQIMRGFAEGGEVWAIPWPCCYEFFGVVTNPRIWSDSATSPDRALRQLQAWTGSPNCRLIGETSNFWPILERFISKPYVRGGVVHDARVAAICVAHAARHLLTRDRDFELFPELVTVDPFAA